ncbi:MAG TPA: type III-A CRISPR-associated protein Csm2 [Nitrospirae bacterium]|nr:type III-A CRISPR-associated protein Csm2 [Nitrospirota bacterium]
MEIRLRTPNGNIEPELFSTRAQEIAERIFEGQIKTNGKANKPTQLRKFYDEVLKFNSIIKGLSPERQDEEFRELLPYLKMLNAKAAYAMGRDLITREFKDFLHQSLNQVNNKEDFEIFAGLFEAFMGFYKYYDEKGERPQRQRDRGGRR